MPFADPNAVMRYAIGLARRGQGFVEPNPMVGAVLVDSDLNLLGQGWHERFGEAHAEVNAIRNAEQSGCDFSTATLFVTLEPCQHTGKTPPCTEAILEAGIPRIVIGTTDPAAHTSARGIAALKHAGVKVQVGLLESECVALIAPFAKNATQSLPWVIAKWAMTLDGRIASRTGHSQWISSPESRKIVHTLRGRVDAIMVGAGTALADDPQLTARPAGPRTARRVVLDRRARLSVESKLASTAAQTPTIVFAEDDAPTDNVARLKRCGVDVAVIDCGNLTQVLSQLHVRGCTNVLVEGGGALLGSFFDQQLIDEAHVFVSPKIVGGANAISPIGGEGLELIPDLPNLRDMVVQQIAGDVYISGRVEPPSRPPL